MPGSSDRVARISSRINFGRLATRMRIDLPISLTPRTAKYWRMSEKEKTQRRPVVLANLALGSSIRNRQPAVPKSTKNFPRLDERVLPDPRDISFPQNPLTLI